MTLKMNADHILVVQVNIFSIAAVLRSLILSLESFVYTSIVVRAVTDLVDPDLLTTRIQNSRSGSVEKIILCLLNLIQNFVHLKFVLKF